MPGSASKPFQTQGLGTQGLGTPERIGAFTVPFALAGTMGEAFARACAEWQQEVARFANARLEGDIELAKSLSECRSLAEAMRLQQAWAGDTLQAYAKETGQLMEIAGRMAQEGIATMETAGR